MCQFKCLLTIEQMNSRQVELKEVLRKKLSLYKRKCNYLRNMMNLGQQVSFQRDDQNNNKVPIKPGDIVKVLPRDKIIRLLDYRGIYKGCPFIEEMYDHCDKEYKVLKEASYFYDEVKERVCKCKDIVILEETICSGKQKLYKETCDLRCYFFWHKDWLEKIGG